MNIKKITALLCAVVMVLSLAACGSNGDKAENKHYTVGICQLVQHDALDAATKGFRDAITDALGKINAVAEQYPALRSAENYKQAMGAVERYEGSLRSARLVYNDCVTKLNRAVRMFPTSLIAGMLHFSAREYLKTEEDKTARPEMK